MNLAYKILPRHLLKKAGEAGLICGDNKDRRDGFIHLSTKSQLDVTAKRYINQRGLLLICVDLYLVNNVKWEPSRRNGNNSELYPHVYGGGIPMNSIVWTKPFNIKIL